ncbi:MAG: type IX secretion system membrane protein PorP/SprF [Cyclobacteriaceae bacterium]
MTQSMRNFFGSALLSMATMIVFAQDPQFSQYYQSPLYLNPGFTGITNQQRATFIQRIQWPNLPQAFVTSAASYDIWVDELKSGFGIIATTDKMGSAGWRTTTVGLNYSYKVRLTDKIVFSPGLNFGYGINGLDRSKLSLGDGLEFSGQSLDPELQRLGNTQYFDFGAGFVLYNKDLFLGAAFSHINNPNLSILSTETRLPMKMVIHGGGRLTLNGGIRTVARASYLTPSFIYRIQGLISQLDLGVNYHIDPVSIGVWYRGKPFESTVTNTIQQDALIFTMGIYLKNLTIGYSYDFTTSGFSTASGGAHEVSLVYEFEAKPMHRGVKKRNRLIPCPTFNSKAGFWN